MCFLPAQVRMYNDLPYTVFTPEGWMGLRVQSAVARFIELCLLQFFVALVLVGLRKQFVNNFVFPHEPVLLVLIIITIAVSRVLSIILFAVDSCHITRNHFNDIAVSRVLTTSSSVFLREIFRKITPTFIKFAQDNEYSCCHRRRYTSLPD